MMSYDYRQIDSVARRQNGVKACEIVSIDPDRGLCLLVPGLETVFVKPMDFEVGNYGVGQWVDCVIWVTNGHISSCQYIGMTPPKFIPEE